jgi:hypothetical protein
MDSHTNYDTGLAASSDVGALFVGLDATPTGSDANNDVVADFTGSAQTLFAHQSFATPVIATHSQTLGSTFKLAIPGKWLVEMFVPATGAGSVLAALGIDNTAGELNANPAPPNSRIKGSQLYTGATGDASPLFLSATFKVSRDVAAGAATGLVRALLSNNAGGGAAAANLTVASAWIRFTYLGELPAFG